MPDISMCNGKDCPSRFQCYRFTAEPTPGWQAYADFNVDRRGDKCASFWPNGKTPPSADTEMPDHKVRETGETTDR